MSLRQRNKLKNLQKLSGVVSSEDEYSLLEDLMLKATKVGNDSNDCSICLCPLDEGVIKMHKCDNHYFHDDCIRMLFTTTGFRWCPICRYEYLPSFGSQPPGGIMTFDVIQSPLSGYTCKTIRIRYSFPDGEYKGVSYTGNTRLAYLPDNEEGNIVLRMLIKCFRYRKTFMIGDSLTTGIKNTIVWGNVHHKSSMTPGPYGYPDPTYIPRVVAELNYLKIFDE